SMRKSHSYDEVTRILRGNIQGRPTDPLVFRCMSLNGRSLDCSVLKKFVYNNVMIEENRSIKFLLQLVKSAAEKFLTQNELFIIALNLYHGRR
ncbi:hypothetical protein L9F63_012378, partial [Diploptera punctata]